VVGIAIAPGASVSQIPTAWTALSNTSIGTIGPDVTVAVFTVLAVLMLMAALFADSVLEVTKKPWIQVPWRVLAVIIRQATFRVRDSGVTLGIVVKSYSLLHNDVVTATFSNRITDTSLLSLFKGEVGDVPIDTFLGTK
jgi:hypothetical protein